MTTKAKSSALPLWILFAVLFAICLIEGVSAIDRTPAYKADPDTDRSVFVQRP